MILFLGSMFICCGSSLLSKESAARYDLTRIGWGMSNNVPSQPFYSVQMAITLCVFCGVMFGLALAGLGLGLQAQRRGASTGGVIVTFLATFFWQAQTIFFVRYWRSIPLILLCGGLVVIFAVLLGLSIYSLREMILHPPPRGFELLPADYQIPYSHMHQDPPEVRLARELNQRRERLAVQQKELEMLEEKLKRKR